MYVCMGFPGGSGGKESACQCKRRKRCRFDLCVEKIPWSRKWKPTPIFLSGKSLRQRNLGGYTPWGCKESDTNQAWVKDSLKVKTD